MANPEHLAVLMEGAEVWNKWRAEHPEYEIGFDHPGPSHTQIAGVHLNRVDLSNADLRRANLANMNLTYASLENADLSEARLHLADLTCADLRNANLTEAALYGTSLIGADLAGATLRRAHLVFAKLQSSRLSGAIFSHAKCNATFFADLDLSDVAGLEGIEHLGPSTIGLDTFFQSKGKIPEAFLRGAGVPEDLIQHLSSFHVGPIQFFSCFISYSHADKAFARRLHDALQAGGIRCWLDEKQLLPGDQIHRAVDEAVRLWDKVLLCCSKTSLTSWWVDNEIQKALMKEEQLWKERGKQVLAIIPLNLDGQLFDPQWQDWKNQHLTTRLAADFTGWEKDNAKFDTQFEQVVRALRADDRARETPPKSKL